MKKLLYLFCASLLALTSCSSDDSNSSDSASSILPKTVKYIVPSEPSSNRTYTYVFDGNKIVSVSNGRSRSEYTYDGNVIVKIIHYITDIESGEESKYQENSYTYTNDKLTTYSSALGFSTYYPSGSQKDKIVYTYNSDGTVIGEGYEIDKETGTETEYGIVEAFTITNGNMIKSVAASTYDYEFDSKNNPFKNILGFNLLLHNSVNNIVKTTYFHSSQWGVYNSETITGYVYDANGYPTKEIVYQEDGTTVSYINEYTY